MNGLDQAKSNRGLSKNKSLGTIHRMPLQRSQSTGFLGGLKNIVAAPLSWLTGGSKEDRRPDDSEDEENSAVPGSKRSRGGANASRKRQRRASPAPPSPPATLGRAAVGGYLDPPTLPAIARNGLKQFNTLPNLSSPHRHRSTKSRMRLQIGQFQAGSHTGVNEIPPPHANHVEPGKAKEREPKSIFGSSSAYHRSQPLGLPTFGTAAPANNFRSLKPFPSSSTFVESSEPSPTHVNGFGSSPSAVVFNGDRMSVDRGPSPLKNTTPYLNGYPSGKSPSSTKVFGGLSLEESLLRRSSSLLNINQDSGLRRSSSILVFDEVKGVTTLDELQASQNLPTQQRAPRNNAERILRALEQATPVSETAKFRRQQMEAVKVPTPTPGSPAGRYLYAKPSLRTSAKGSSDLSDLKTEHKSPGALKRYLQTLNAAKRGKIASIREKRLKEEQEEKAHNVDQMRDIPPTKDSVELVEEKEKSQPDIVKAPSMPGRATSSLRAGRKPSYRTHQSSSRPTNRFSAHFDDDDDDAIDSTGPLDKQSSSTPALSAAELEKWAGASRGSLQFPVGFKLGETPKSPPLGKPVEKTAADRAAERRELFPYTGPTQQSSESTSAPTAATEPTVTSQPPLREIALLKQSDLSAPPSTISVEAPATKQPDVNQPLNLPNKDQPSPFAAPSLFQVPAPSSTTKEKTNENTFTNPTPLVASGLTLTTSAPSQPFALPTVPSSTNIFGTLVPRADENKPAVAPLFGAGSTLTPKTTPLFGSSLPTTPATGPLFGVSKPSEQPKSTETQQPLAQPSTSPFAAIIAGASASQPLAAPTVAGPPQEKKDPVSTSFPSFGAGTFSFGKPPSKESPATLQTSVPPASSAPEAPVPPPVAPATAPAPSEPPKVEAASAPTKPIFSFNQNDKPATSVFGNISNQSKSNEGATAPLFGSSSTTESTSLFGSSSSTTSPFSFGVVNKPSETSTTPEASKPSASPFAFSSASQSKPSETTTTPNEPPSSSPFGLGAPKPAVANTPSSLFGAAPTASIDGGANSAATNANGNSKSPFSFSSTNSTSSPFSFGAKPTSTTPAFGSTPTINVQKPEAADDNAMMDDTPESTSAPQPPTASPFAFVSSTSQPPVATSPATSPFAFTFGGTGSTQSNPFAAGNTSTPPASSHGTSGFFGATAPAQSPSPALSFTGIPPVNPPAFGSAPASPFQSPSAPFSTLNSAPPASPFTFNASSNGVVSPTTASHPAPVFTFGAGAPPASPTNSDRVVRGLPRRAGSHAGRRPAQKR